MGLRDRLRVPPSGCPSGSILPDFVSSVRHRLDPALSAGWVMASAAPPVTPLWAPSR